MKFVRWIFISAGIFGLIPVFSLAYSSLVSKEPILPDGTATGLFFYGSFVQYICWQILYLFVSRDPLRYRLIIIPAFFAIALTPFYPIWLYIFGFRPWIPITLINLVFALLFVLAFWLTGREMKSRSG